MQVAQSGGRRLMRLRDIVTTTVAEEWEVDPKRIRLAGGWAFDLKDTDRKVPIAEAFNLAEAKFGTLGATGWYDTPKDVHGDYRGGTIGASPAYSFTAHVAEVDDVAVVGLGCTALGILYKQGWGVTKDYGRARQLLKQGCEGGNASGCTGAGVLYQNGLGGTRDYQKARELYEQGCEGGDSGGCNNLGVVYMKGLGVTKDYQRAHDLYKAGCDDSSSVGCYNLAVSYHKGHGVEKDPTLALELYKKACIEGDERACALYERLSRTSQP